MSDASREDWEALGLEPQSDVDAVHSAYRKRRALFDRDSLATYNLLLDDERTAILDRLDAAYQRIMEALRAAQPIPPPTSPTAAPDPSPPLQPVPDPVVSPGAFLGQRRRSRGFALTDVAAETKIRPTILEWIENEEFARLPTPVYVRGFVIQIARCLGLPDHEEVARLYLARMEEERSS